MAAQQGAPPAAVLQAVEPVPPLVAPVRGGPEAAREAEPKAVACADPEGAPRVERAAQSPAEPRSAEPKAPAEPGVPAAIATAPAIGRVQERRRVQERKRNGAEPKRAAATPVQPVNAGTTMQPVQAVAVKRGRQVNGVGEKVPTTAARHAAR
ncbi:hypothetical protein [Methylobacterium sp. CM6257]